MVPVQKGTCPLCRSPTRLSPSQCLGCVEGEGRLATRRGDRQKAQKSCGVAGGVARFPPMMSARPYPPINGGGHGPPPLLSGVGWLPGRSETRSLSWSESVRDGPLPSRRGKLTSFPIPIVPPAILILVVCDVGRDAGGIHGPAVVCFIAVSSTGLVRVTADVERGVCTCHPRDLGPSGCLPPCRSLALSISLKL
jgi:hypothetical protein